MPHDAIGQDVVVTLHYRLTLDDGSLVEESTADDPLTYLHGCDNIIPGLEEALDGMSIGEKKMVVVEPEDAYGEYDPDEIVEVDLVDLPPGLQPEIGMMLAVPDEEGNHDIAQVTEVGSEFITLDFNHPLSGKRLHFDVTIAELRDPTAEELEHGHVHDGEEDED
jgi:FKBP-type peptidyl-prolyl cis-trans isomerase SlyD